jgi:hypothetical protein
MTCKIGKSTGLRVLSKTLLVKCSFQSFFECFHWRPGHKKIFGSDSPKIYYRKWEFETYRSLRCNESTNFVKCAETHFLI